MTGLIRFDDEHIIEFFFDAENHTISLKIVDPNDTYLLSEVDYTAE